MKYVKVTNPTVPESIRKLAWWPVSQGTLRLSRVHGGDLDSIRIYWRKWMKVNSMYRLMAIAEVMTTARMALRFVDQEKRSRCGLRQFSGHKSISLLGPRLISKRWEKQQQCSKLHTRLETFVTLMNI